MFHQRNGSPILGLWLSNQKIDSLAPCLRMNRSKPLFCLLRRGTKLEGSGKGYLRVVTVELTIGDVSSAGSSTLVVEFESLEILLETC